MLCVILIEFQCNTETVCKLKKVYYKVDQNVTKEHNDCFLCRIVLL